MPFVSSSCWQPGLDLAAGSVDWALDGAQARFARKNRAASDS